MSKVVRIDMSNLQITTEQFDKSILFGNRGLVVKMINDEVNPTCDPLGPENKLFISTGLLAGTQVATSGRLSFGAKSPLTGTIKESNVGGNAGSHMAKHGIKTIAIEGYVSDEKWYLIRIDADSNVSLIPADQYIGKNNYEMVDLLFEEYGSKSSICTIGVAGERKYTSASIQVTDNSVGHPSRAAGRGGLGAVMGSKNIKAIIFEKPNSRNKPEMVDKAKFDSARKELITLVKEDPVTGMGLALLGTVAFIDMTAESGILPVKNFSGELLKPEDLAKIDSTAFGKRAKQHGGRTGVSCQPGCTIRCSNVINDVNGDIITSGLEYETVAQCGPNCDIFDYDFLARIDRICDDFGVDTIEVGDALGVAMDAGKIPWGDIDATMALVNEMLEGTEFGKILGNGTEAVGKKLNHGRIPTVKGQGMAAYDPRPILGMGVEYATFPQGADHTGGHPMIIEGLDHTNPVGQVEVMKTVQASLATCDNLMCMFAWIAMGTKEGLPHVANLIEGMYGVECSVEELMGIGAQTLRMEREFNTKAGFTPADDKLPEFFRTEKTEGGLTFNVPQEEIEKMYL